MYDETRDDATFLWNMNDEFKRDINTMWDICQRDVKLWNTQMIMLGTAEKFVSDDALTITVPSDCLKDAVKRSDGKFVTICRILNGLLKVEY